VALTAAAGVRSGPSRARSWPLVSQGGTGALEGAGGGAAGSVLPAAGVLEGPIWAQSGPSG
jgi:hypothetical protein